MVMVSRVLASLLPARAGALTAFGPMTPGRATVACTRVLLAALTAYARPVTSFGPMTPGMRTVQVVTALHGAAAAYMGMVVGSYTRQRQNAMCAGFI